MEWLACIRQAIGYMEDHLTDGIDLEDVAGAVHLSPFFLQRGFSLMTGVGVGEYLRSRRLYEAALALKSGGEKVIDVALRYGYETPESFTKAFARFHGGHAHPGAGGGGPAAVPALDHPHLDPRRQQDGTQDHPYVPLQTHRLSEGVHL